MNYCTRGEQANHYTNDALYGFLNKCKHKISSENKKIFQNLLGDHVLYSSNEMRNNKVKTGTI